MEDRYLTNLMPKLYRYGSSIGANTEGGRRGQAFVAACLDLVFADVQSGAVNDPDARVPGDVAVGNDSDGMTLAAEAKQKPVQPATILQFVARIASAGIPRGIYAAFARTQPALDTMMLQQTALERHGVLLNVLTRPEQLLQAALLWTTMDLETALRVFPTLLAKRLVDFNCKPGSGDEWAGIMAASPLT